MSFRKLFINAVIVVALVAQSACISDDRVQVSVDAGRDAPLDTPVDDADPVGMDVAETQDLDAEVCEDGPCFDVGSLAGCELVPGRLIPTDDELPLSCLDAFDDVRLRAGITIRSGTDPLFSQRGEWLNGTAIEVGPNLVVIEYSHLEGSLEETPLHFRWPHSDLREVISAGDPVQVIWQWSGEDAIALRGESFELFSRNLDPLADPVTWLGAEFIFVPWCSEDAISVWHLDLVDEVGDTTRLHPGDSYVGSSATLYFGGGFEKVGFATPDFAAETISGMIVNVHISKTECGQ